MTARLLFSPDVPAEVRTAIEPMLTKRLWRLPSWCHDFTVDWDDEPTEARPGYVGIARVTTDERYRCGQMTIYAAWLSLGADERERRIAHELSHIPTLPLIHLLDEALALIPKADRKLKDMLLERGVALNEGITCDLTEAFERGPER